MSSVKCRPCCLGLNVLNVALQANVLIKGNGEPCDRVIRRQWFLRKKEMIFSVHHKCFVQYYDISVITETERQSGWLLCFHWLHWRWSPMTTSSAAVFSDGVSNHRQLDCLLKTLFKLTTKKQIIRITGPLWGESTLQRVDSPHKGPVMRKTFPCHDVIMTCRCRLQCNQQPQRCLHKVSRVSCLRWPIHFFENVVQPTR